MCDICKYIFYQTSTKVVQQCIKNRNGPAAGVHQIKERRVIDYYGTGLVLMAMSFMDSLLL